MARCRATLKSKRLKKVILVCDLSEEHGLVHPKHFDKEEQTTWNIVNGEPVPVMSTRTSPTGPRHSVKKSIAAHTGVFEVVT